MSGRVVVRMACSGGRGSSSRRIRDCVLYALADLLEAQRVLGDNGLFDESSDAILQVGLDAGALNSVDLANGRKLAVEKSVNLPHELACFMSRDRSCG